MHDEEDQQITVFDDAGAGKTVRCSGEIDLDNAPQLHAAIDTALETAVTCWIDLREVTFMDSSAVHYCCGSPTGSVTLPRRRLADRLATGAPGRTDRRRAPDARRGRTRDGIRRTTGLTW